MKEIMSMKESHAAPVAIPTLNRSQHLTRCLESLEMNPWANNTDVYISVDYPPSKEYVDGHAEVINYLEMKMNNNRFKSLSVYYQEKNLGPSGNLDYLYSIIKPLSDVVIVTEDDNEFSPNFLSYINGGLRIFKDDERVIAVCGCKEANWYVENCNVVALQMFPPYGVGMWFDKNDKLLEDCAQVLLNRDELLKRDFRQLKKEDRTLFNLYIVSVLLSEERPFWINGELRLIDTVKSIYLHLTDRFSVVPMTAKSRTWGNDGSGVNMASIDGFNPAERWPLDTEKEFTYVIDGRRVAQSADYDPKIFGPSDKNHKIESEYMSIARSTISNIKADIGYYLLKLNHFDIDKTKKMLKMLKRWT